MLEQPPHQSVTRLVEADHLLLLFGEDLTLLYASWKPHACTQACQRPDSNVCPALLNHIFLPASTRSTAYSKLKVSMDLCPSLAACRAASLHMLAISAPVRKQQVGKSGFIIPVRCCQLTVGSILLKSSFIFTNSIGTNQETCKYHWILGWVRPGAENRN